MIILMVQTKFFSDMCLAKYLNILKSCSFHVNKEKFEKILNIFEIFYIIYIIIIKKDQILYLRI